MKYSKFLEFFILKLGDITLGTSFIKRLKECRINDRLSETELEKMQLKRLNHILDSAINKSRYYNQFDIVLDKDNPVKTLKEFPILTKSDIKDNKESISVKPINKLIKLSSSGSSGEQGDVYLSKDEISITRAQQTRWWEWAGYKLGDQLLQTGMAEKRSFVKKMKDFFLNTQYVHAFAPSPDEIEETLNQAKSKLTKHFYGYASSLYVFSEVAKDRNINITFKSTLSWGDKMFDHYKKSIQEVFGTRVFETYGCTEGFMIGAQYDIPYLYIMTPWLYLELLDDKGNEVEDGEIGHVVVTSLFAESFPLIRYKLGDLAVKLPKKKYPHNRKLAYPLLEKVIGRDTDIVKTRSGKNMIVHSFTGIFEYYPEIKQFQVVQNNLDSIIINFVPGKNFTPAILEEISRKIITQLGESIEISFAKVNQILPSPSGKPQIIKSLI